MPALPGLAAWLFAGLAQAAASPPGHAVASAHPLATDAGIRILQDGGNAFDAAVTVSAVLAVVEPYSSGIGGGGFWLLHREADGVSVMVDGRETAPRAAGPDFYLTAQGTVDADASRDGPRAAAVPGAAAAWVHIARRYGSMPLDRLLQPAIAHARDGFAADAKLTAMLARFGPRLSPAAAVVFLPGGRTPSEGELIRQPDLAGTLEQLARHGHAGFYGGPVAQKLVNGVRRAGGVLAAEDLAAYAVAEREPVVTWFRDYRVTAASPPSAGGIALAQVLQMLEARGWPAGAANPDHLVAEALRRAYRDRAAHLGDPGFVAIPTARLLSRDYALSLARTISPDAATPSSALPPTREGDNTTHFSILDGSGNRVAGTLSINLPFGSGFMPEGTGVLMNDEMDDFAASVTVSNAYGLVGSQANAIAPGKRPLSSMTPTFVEGPRGLLILGTPGGSRIISMVLLGVLGFTQGAELQEIVGRPRFHHQYLPDRIEFEPGAFTAEQQAALKKRGHELKPLDSTYGNLQAVWWDPVAGRLEAAADPRGVGTGRVLITLPAARPAAATAP